MIAMILLLGRNEPSDGQVKITDVKIALQMSR
jgi:hypothetical protein